MNSDYYFKKEKWKIDKFFSLLKSTVLSDFDYHCYHTNIYYSRTAVAISIMVLVVLFAMSIMLGIYYYISTTRKLQISGIGVVYSKINI